VTKAHLYEPDLNPSYLEFARHYGVAVIPARREHPKDKAKVESGVRLAGMWILARLRKRTFFSLSELNDAIAELLPLYNARAFQQRPGSRESLFLELEKPALKPLPAQRYQFAEWRKARAHIDYHVSFEQHAYSVPHTLKGEELDLRITATTVEAFFQKRRVASHARSHRRGDLTPRISARQGVGRRNRDEREVPHAPALRVHRPGRQNSGPEGSARAAALLAVPRDGGTKDLRAPARPHRP